MLNFVHYVEQILIPLCSDCLKKAVLLLTASALFERVYLCFTEFRRI